MALNEKETDTKKKPHEMTNAEYVSKLMAATPSYFFTPTSLPQAGHNFFFSELLRSLVQKRKAEELNLAAMKAKTMSKKNRKTTCPQQYHKTLLEHEYKKPKLTNETIEVDNEQENSQDSVINVDKDDPPPPPTPVATSSSVSTATATSSHQSVPSLSQSAFYPYVDPLHFFIDLRVSAGQIYDRKKEAYLQQALSTWNNNNPIIGKNRNSAFRSVPVSTQSDQSQNFNAINLISNQQSDSMKFQKIFKSTRSDDDDEETTIDNKKTEDIQIFDLDKTEQMN